MQDVPLYHARIVKSYDEYLHKYHPDVDMAPIMDYAGINIYQLEDKGYWLTQRQVNRFHEILVKNSGIADISRRAGQYLPHARAATIVRQYTLGFITPAAAYMVIGKLHAHMSRGVTVETRRVSSNHIELTAIRNPGVTEAPHQCENRLGALEGLARLFTREPARVEHKTCMHVSGDRCVYQIHWEEEPSSVWKRGVRYGTLLAAVASLLLLVAIPSWPGVAAALSLLVLVTGASRYQTHLEKSELAEVVKMQGDLAKDLLDETDARYNNAMFVQEIGQALGSILDTDRLLEMALETIEKRLNFDRGLIMLADQELTRLTCRASYGYGEEGRASLKDQVIRLDESHDRDPFVTAFRQKKPILGKDQQETEKTTAAGSPVPPELRGSQSILCVPILYEGKAEGILAVDNHRSRRQIDESEINLLSGVAIQIGISIHNAEAYPLIRESENRFRALIQNSSDVISILDEQGRFLYNTSSAEKIFGYTPEELIGQRPFSFIHPDELPKVRQAFARVARQTRPGSPTEFRFRKKDGSWVFVEAVGSNLYHYPGIKGMVITSRDVSDRKRSEQERQVLEERLQRAQKMEALGTLAGGVAHDLNNVLGVLVGYSELTLTEMSEDDPRREYITNIMTSGQRGAAIVQDLLTLARRGVAVSKVVNLNTLIDGYLRTPEFKKLIASHPQIEIRLDLKPDLMNIKGSPVHLGKTLMNLVINATEAIADAGVVTIRTENRHLDRPLQGYEITEEGNYAVLTVSDNGRGIAAADLGKIFEPFYTKKVMGQSGTGLGLAVVWGAVKDHGGFINVQSENGRGTQFTLFFPVTHEDAAEDPSTTPREAYAGDGESILVVDDVLGQRTLAVKILTGLGYNVQAVANGEEALAFLERNRVDLLILDMIMEPGMDGLETYQRALKINPHQRAIVVSGFSETERVKQAQELGAGPYVRKPYIIEQFGLAVRKELDRP